MISSETNVFAAVAALRAIYTSKRFEDRNQIEFHTNSKRWECCCLPSRSVSLFFRIHIQLVKMVRFSLFIQIEKTAAAATTTECRCELKNNGKCVL